MADRSHGTECSHGSDQTHQGSPASSGFCLAFRFFPVVLLRIEGTLGQLRIHQLLGRDCPPALLSALPIQIAVLASSTLPLALPLSLLC